MLWIKSHGHILGMNMFDCTLFNDRHVIKPVIGSSVATIHYAYFLVLNVLLKRATCKRMRVLFLFGATAPSGPGPSHSRGF